MARKVLVTLVDDLDGKELGEDGGTVSFAFEGTAYEIDLSAKNTDGFRKALGKYIESARKVGRVKAGGESRQTRQRSNRGLVDAATGVNPKEVRAWAVKEGLLPENTRGRIPGEIVEKYKAAHVAA